VLIVPKRGGKVVVLKHERGSGQPRVLVLTQSRSLVRLSAHDFRGQFRKIATIELPRPYTPRSQSFQRSVADTLRRLKLRDAEIPDDTDVDVDDLQDAIAAHPLHDAPGADIALRAAWQAERIARDIARLERQISSRNESLARQFDRVLGVLRTWGYVEEWTLTDSGRLLTRLNSEGELVVAEALREGRLDDIDAATLAAVVSCFTFQRRGPDSNDPMPPRRWPNQEIARRSRALDAVWRDLNVAEREARLPETRRPDPGFSAAIYAWVNGEDLADVLDDEEMTGGDFVRNVKQTIDLLRQIADVVPNAQTAATARAAADACLRGVIEASSVVKAASA
jgi:ATP-dependent RNA helicase HelY